MQRQIGEASHCLEETEQLTPEQIRAHRVARAVARDLIQLSGYGHVQSYASLPNVSVCCPDRSWPDLPDALISVKPSCEVQLPSHYEFQGAGLGWDSAVTLPPVRSMAWQSGRTGPD